MQTRLTFICCQCQRNFTQLVETEGNPIQIVHCPYCGARCEAKLSPDQSRVSAVYRGTNGPSGSPSGTPTAPIQTTVPDEEA
ncbi:hypothetical protein L0E83_07195 [Marichromatium gracile]|uniref:hypothetical protein n=1 Tax=Marichromatium gracile TaxID=1048 RepID=UPI001F2C9CD0|nr:hypothetical protein [Marichromatium gracile]MCF1183222.1 hypothetical protein [Marichromatium gracile]